MIAAEEVECDAVYSSVLVCGHVVSIDGVECLCIGHGILDLRASIGHSYFQQKKREKRDRPQQSSLRRLLGLKH